MINTMLVSLAVTAGVIALAGVPLRCWQFGTGQFRSQIPRHALARATFRLFAFLILVPNALAWAYAIYIVYRYLHLRRRLRAGMGRDRLRGRDAGLRLRPARRFLLTARRRPKRWPAPA